MIPNLAAALERALASQPDTWDERRIHASDLAVAIEGERCPRQLWLRLRGFPKRPETSGQRLMFRHGYRIHEDLVPMLREGLPEGWRVEAVEQDISDRLPPGVVGRFDYLLVGPNVCLILDCKTLRGRAFQYGELPKPAHVLQVQTYVMAADVDGGLLLYVDREGQNWVRQFYVKRDDQRVRSAIAYALSIAESDEPPMPLEPVLERKKRKGFDALYLRMPWQCDYCPYRDVSCEGALPPWWRDKGVVGHVGEDGLTMAEGCESLRPIVERLLEGATA